MEFEFDVEGLDWSKMDGLIPAVVQDSQSGRVLMLGTVNRDSLAETRRTGRVTFWSRSRRRLWTKGETSGNFLECREIRPDCDRDALLVLARPAGPTCHEGTLSCFGADDRHTALEFLSVLENLIQDRHRTRPRGSYTSRLFEKGLGAIAQKVGEEGVETALSAYQDRRRTVEESADLIYHLLVLLRERDLPLSEVLSELKSRHQRLSEGEESV